MDFVVEKSVMKANNNGCNQENNILFHSHEITGSWKFTLVLQNCVYSYTSLFASLYVLFYSKLYAQQTSVYQGQ